MTQERITSLRILPNNKKKILSPVMYLLIGFILGLLFAALIFWVFIIDSSTPKANMLQINKEHEFIQPDSKETLANSDAHITAHQTIEIQSEAIESEEDNNFIQPASHDLNKFFQHAPVAAPSPTGSRVHHLQMNQKPSLYLPQHLKIYQNVIIKQYLKQ